eukprot:CAMPEP_0113848408 /NCGR_PEP_ID=MMETSP0372-20130328/2461_1 /TAXON_ID=340204 /ORGANISM="Lankesteria abbotti" /LENGTH=136 /DNA_ID=CAMNT_0000817889 /DNA_START=1346 /DNA_END=1753 /DNA_ORIENTATION=- /assembly_acc=CAM_ASM_000359
MTGHTPWTSTELFEVILIFTLFHSNSSLSLGFGVVDEQDCGLPIIVDDPTLWNNDDHPGCFREQYEDPILLAADYWNTSGKRSDSSHATTTDNSSATKKEVVNKRADSNAAPTPMDSCATSAIPKERKTVDFAQRI